MAGNSFSEDHLRAKLNLSRRADDARNGSRSARADGCVRQIELWRVEEIEAFGAELQPRACFDPELLEKGEVEIHAARPVQDIPSRIAVREWRRRRKRRGVEPAVDRRVRQSAVADAVRAAACTGVDRRRTE